VTGIHTMIMATQHLTDDDLILHYYGETARAEQAGAAGHLQQCARCRTEYDRLQRVLGSIDDSAGVVDLPPSFERTVWARLEPALDPPRRGWVSWLLTSPAPLALTAAVVVLVIGAFLAGRSLAPPPVTSSSATTTGIPAEQVRDRILLTEVGEHLDRSQMALVELVSVAEDASADISAERSRAEQLLADSRLYRQTADDTGDVALSQMLDEIERVLTDVAATPESGSSRDLADVRRRIESRDLLFKVRVVASQLRERQRAPFQRQAGPRS
jgi:hypothetical protein